tara:strand:+ start:206 stop:1162 length:957 start_codon:yes stop_codon:yes gene_type:complete
MTFLFTEEMSFKADFISSVKVGDFIPKNFSSTESSITTIPTLSIKKEIKSNNYIDFEYAFQLKRILNGDSTIFSINNNYRFWIRYINQNSEMRIGLQKIIFGPSQILRSLSWFDSYNIKDPSLQTIGIKAARYKYFVNNSLDFTTWLIEGSLKTLSIGGRINLLSDIGEWAFTYHQSRYGIDFRYDGLYGFWFEGVIYNEHDELIPYGTIGIDYTFNLFNGIYFLSETMIIENIDKDFFSALLISKPINFLHKVILITQIDWNNKYQYNYFQWNTSFDRFSINYILSINPKEIVPRFQRENTSIDYGISHKIMFIFNY